MFVAIEDVCFSYSNAKTRALDNFTLKIEKGEVISILGRSGSGKSTVLRLLAGLEKPEKGRLVIQNEVIFDNKTFLQPEKRGIGMVFQDYALFPSFDCSREYSFRSVPDEEIRQEKASPGCSRTRGAAGFRKTLPVSIERRSAAACCHSASRCSKPASDPA